MHPRIRSTRLLAIPLLIGLLLATGCKKKIAPPEENKVYGLGADLALFVHLRPQGLQQSQMFSEVIRAVAPEGTGTLAPDDLNRKMETDFGVRPETVNSITFAAVEDPEQPKAPSKFILIVACQDDIAQDLAKNKLGKGQTDRPKFTAIGDGRLLHFPDLKTLVVVHEDLVDRYLEGYAKDRNTWPFTSAVRKAADAHTALLVADLSQMTTEEKKKELPVKLLGNLADAKAVMLSVDFNGGEFNLSVRGRYEDDAAAQTAKESLTKLVEQGKGQLDQVMNEPGNKDNSALVNLIGAAKKALDEAAIELKGAELIAKAAYKGERQHLDIVAQAVQRVRVTKEQWISWNNLKQISIALMNYHATFGKYPIHGEVNRIHINDLKEKPLLSWRVTLLPFMDQTELYDQFKPDEPWDSEHNKKLIDKMPKVYAPPKWAAVPPGHTYYQMVVGPAAMRPPIAVTQIIDGASNTLLIVEAAEPVIWTKPADIMIREVEMPANLKKRFGGAFPNRCNAGMCDGSVRSLDLQKIDAKSLWRLITPDGGD